MKFLKILKISNAASRLIEEKIYETVALEIQRGELRTGLWAKALAESRGDEQKAKSLYISHRVQSIKDEKAIAEALKNNPAGSSKSENPTSREENPNEKYAIYTSCKSSWEHEAALDKLHSINLAIHSAENLKIVIGPFKSRDVAGYTLRKLIFEHKIDGFIELLK